MAETKREIERKYAAERGVQLPDLASIAPVASVTDEGVAVLDAVYYDTAGERLAADGITLRRRTGGADEGWHLKLPVGPDTRDEIRAPLSDRLPPALAGLVRSRVRDQALVPLMRLRSERDVRHLLGADGTPLAEVSVDEVTAERLSGGDGTARWTEIEVELAEGADPALLDTVERAFRDAGIRPAATASKLARALADTRPDGEEGTAAKGKPGAWAGDLPAAPLTAGDLVLRYVRAQVTAIVGLDPAVRRDQHDSVHRMRVATRRLRSAFRSYRKVLDRAVTDPIGDELKWLAGELGIDRDREVLTDRLYERLGELPPPLLVGPVRGRLRTWSRACRGGSRRRLIGVLDGKRYLALLGALDALLAAPPLLPAAARPPQDVIPKAVGRDFDRLATHVEHALGVPPGQERDIAMHEARKAAKRTRYAAEAARPVLGRPAKRLVDRMTAVQELLGDHQDSVVARQTLRELAAQAHAAGESAFTFGVLYAREEARAAQRERELPGLWAGIAREKHLIAPD